MHRELAAAYPERYRPDLAAQLSNRGARLSALGRSAEALPATEEAVAMSRELAAAYPERYSTTCRRRRWRRQHGRGHVDGVVDMLLTETVAQSERIREPAGRHPVLGVELVLDRPQQRKRRHRPVRIGHVPHVVRRVHDDRARSRGGGRCLAQSA